jgi:hypothetical protein
MNKQQKTTNGTTTREPTSNNVNQSSTVPGEG